MPSMRDQQKEPQRSSKNTDRKSNSRMRYRVRALLAEVTFRKCRRLVFQRVPDAVFILFVVSLWRFYINVGNIATSAYSLVVASMATLGMIMIYITVRYNRAIFQKLPSLWECYWILILTALFVEFPALKYFRSQVVNFQAGSLIYVVVIALLTAASIIAIVSMLRTRTSVLRLSGFLLAQALLIFAFAQPYIYCNFIDSKWNLPVLEQQAMATVSAGPQTVIRTLTNPNSEEVYGIVTFLRESQEAIPEDLYDIPGLNVLITGACERANFGAALYLSTITWTSVGFGDLIPTPATRVYAAAESILGYLFMAALAAVMIKWAQKPTNKAGKGYE